MPRVANPEKDLYAKSLLAQNKSFNEIQTQLKSFFDSGISPNRLIQFKKEISQGISDSENICYSNNPLYFNEGILEPIKSELEQNKIIVQKIWQKMDQYDQIISQLGSSLQNFKKSFQKFQNEQDPRNFTEDDFLNYFDEQKAKLTTYLYDDYTDRTTITTRSGMDPRLVKLILTDLEHMKILDVQQRSFGEKTVKMYKL